MLQGQLLTYDYFKQVIETMTCTLPYVLHDKL